MSLPKIQAMLHFIIVLRQLSASHSVCIQMNSINNTPHWTLLSPRTSPTHGLHRSYSHLLVCGVWPPSLSHCIITYFTSDTFWSLSLSLSLSPQHSSTSQTLLGFSVSDSLPFSPTISRALICLTWSTCIMHGEWGRLCRVLSVPIMPSVNKLVGKKWSTVVRKTVPLNPLLKPSICVV